MPHHLFVFFIPSSTIWLALLSPVFAWETILKTQIKIHVHTLIISFPFILSPVFAWEAYEKGAEINLQSDPTKLEMLASEYKKRKDDFKTQTKDSILEKYGGEEHLEAPPKQLLLAQTVSGLIALLN